MKGTTWAAIAITVAIVLGSGMSWPKGYDVPEPEPVMYSCQYDDEVMGSDGTCYTMDSRIDAVIEGLIQDGHLFTRGQVTDILAAFALSKP